MRRQAVLALGASGSEKIVPILRGLLPEADAELKKTIADALGRVHSVDVAETLALLLDDDDLTIVTKALVGLRKNPFPRAMPQLLQLCNHQITIIRRHALEALAGSGQSEAYEVMQQMLLNDLAVEVRAAAARECGKLGDKRFVSVLEIALRDEPAVRSASLASLGSIGERSSIPALLAYVKDPVPEVRYHAVAGLGKLKAIKAVNVVQGLLEDPDEMVRVGAVTALQALGVNNAPLPMSRKVAGLASSLIPDRIAGVIPAKSISVAIVLLISVFGAGWFLVPNVGASVDNSIALAKAKPLLQASWLSSEGDVILIRDGSKSDIWNAKTGDFKDKVEVPKLAACGPEFGLLTMQGGTLVSWAPGGYQTNSWLVKTPPTEKFELSGDGKFATHLDKNRRVWIWDAVEGKDVVELSLKPEPLPVLNSDGSIVAGADAAGNIVLINLRTGKVIGKSGALG